MKQAGGPQSRPRSSGLNVWFVLLALILTLVALASRSRAATDPAQGPGGPILIVTAGSPPGTPDFGSYYAEILRTEGLNAFEVTTLSTLSAASLASHDLVILAAMPLDATQASLLGNWVSAGGRLVAMAPDDKLSDLLGLTPLGTSLSDAYLRVDTSTRPGNGIVASPLQFHGTARRYTLNGASALALLYNSASAATDNPALSLRSIGAGQAAAFTFDLASSVVTTRQGNPAWAAQERDGLPPIRSDDKFFGNAAGDAQPDWIDLDRLAIPQADELQRLLVNLIEHMNAERTPLPRFWYLPRGQKAAVVMTGDDHGNGGTVGRFEQFKALGPPGCSVADWQCVRATSYTFVPTPMTDAQAAQYTSDGFEVGLHIDTGCADFTPASLQTSYDTQMAALQAVLPGAGPLLTQRHHCIVWSDWSSAAEVQARHGMRLDTSYYFWPPGWVANVPGLFTGSALPMRFARLDGQQVDVYMVATQMTDESGQSYPFTIDTLLDRALGAEGYYGVYTVNAHTDVASSSVADAVVASARARGVPVISARQLLTWLDARNNSSFSALGFNAGVLGFTISKDPAANGLQAMLPMRAGAMLLSTLTRAGVAVNFSVSTIKGVDYAFFTADAGTYAANYGVDASAPSVASTSPAPGAVNVDPTAGITVTFAEAMDAATLNAATIDLRSAANVAVTAAVNYDAATRTATLRPIGGLAATTGYSVTVRGGSADPRVKDAAGNALAATLSWTFTTSAAPPPASAPVCPCTVWSPTVTPTNPAVADPGAVELGVKFRADVDGVITGIRFYKGAGNTGTHQANLWSTSGALLGSALFTAESAAGWQQVDFAAPLAISANTVYVASYFAPNGRYAGDNNFFATTGVDNGAIHLLRDGVSGGNGVYRYGVSSGFPVDTYRATNYWVDVVFKPTGAVPPLPPPPSNACAAPANATVAENCLPGSPPAEWDIAGIGDPGIQGYATDISVNRGGTVIFKVATAATSYRFDIYRLGWYAGLGARKVASVIPSATLPQQQPACLNDAATGLIDCGNWAVSGAWTVPPTAVSGIYIAKLVRGDTGGASHIAFVVRNDVPDGSTSPALLFQTSDTTWQAYNTYGGNSLYTGLPVGRAFKVSYNRPFQTRSVDSGQDWLFNSEYPMLRWLEANGYELSYISGVDSERLPAQLLRHPVFLSVGHDEYWSGGQRANVEAARNAGVHLAFFSGNEIFWKTRWENSIDPTATPYRTLVSYKETHANARIDPTGVWTGTWRDPRFSPPADGGRPENALSGTIFMVNDGATTAIQVPEAEGKLRLWRNTSLATQAPGASASLPVGTLGYEWDVDADNGQRPPGLIRLSSTTVANAPLLQDFGSTYASGSASHALTLYRHASGARVFGAGTVQWPWGLDATHDRAGTAADLRMQQATVNLLADMGVQSATLQAGLVAASPSTDNVAPVSTLSAPLAGASVVAGSTVTISGSASDTGGGLIGGVEVSVDGGASWHPASGRAAWTYRWTVGAPGVVSVKTRAVDDSGNLETAGPGMSLTVVATASAQTCPCTIWPASAVPALASAGDSSTVNLGVRFSPDQGGFISGLRFYKGAANTGTHVGSLWTATGTLLASATYGSETASGWQQVNFATPVAVSAGTVYVASYFAPNGHYAGDNGYFTAAGVDNPPLHALQSLGSGNGVYAYASGPAFPSSSFQASNYWVDVVFTTQSAPATPPAEPPPAAADTTAPLVSTLSPASGATGVSRTANITATFNEAMDPASITPTTIELRGPGNLLVAAAVSYAATTRVATLNPAPTLTALSTYSVTVKGGATDPRVKDLAGNALASSRIWAFTTAR